MHACNGYRLIQLCNIYIYMHVISVKEGYGMVEDSVGSLGGNCMYRDWPSERKDHVLEEMMHE